MKRKLLPGLTLLPVLTALWLSSGSNAVATLSPDQVVGYDFPVQETAEAERAEVEEAVASDTGLVQEGNRR